MMKGAACMCDRKSCNAAERPGASHKVITQLLWKIKIMACVGEMEESGKFGCRKCMYLLMRWCWWLGWTHSPPQKVSGEIQILY